MLSLQKVECTFKVIQKQAGKQQNTQTHLRKVIVPGISISVKCSLFHENQPCLMKFQKAMPS